MTSNAYPEIPEIKLQDVFDIDYDHFNSENICIITGAGSGIGRATAIALAKNGLRVVVTDIDGDGLEETLAKGKEFGLGDLMHAVKGNLSDDDNVVRIVEEASEHGAIKYLANIAGVQHIAPIDEFPMDIYDDMHRVLLRAPLLLSKLCIPHIRASKDGIGCIGNVSSVHGHYVTQNKVAYNICKFGIRGLTQSITAEGDGKIWSFSISPSPVKTPLVVNQIPDIAEQREITVEEVIEDVILKPYKVKELIDPIDIANLFVLGFSGGGRHFAGGDFLLDSGATAVY
jgi:3-hydroxybutyrate dehydrogenase